jgi:hypothetical protein
MVGVALATLSVGLALATVLVGNLVLLGVLPRLGSFRRNVDARSDKSPARELLSGGVR